MIYDSVEKGYIDAILEIDYENKKETEHSVIPETIGRYIHLNDKYGKPIFEHDILSILTQDNNGVDSFMTVLVKYDKDLLSFVGVNKLLEENDSCFPLHSYSGVKIPETEIIGNYFDDPKLVKLHLLPKIK